MASRISGPKPFSCNHCSKSYTSKHSLNRHKQDKHPNAFASADVVQAFISRDNDVDTLGDDNSVTSSLAEDLISKPPSVFSPEFRPMSENTTKRDANKSFKRKRAETQEAQPHPAKRGRLLSPFGARSDAQRESSMEDDSLPSTGVLGSRPGTGTDAATRPPKRKRDEPETETMSSEEARHPEAAGSKTMKKSGRSQNWTEQPNGKSSYKRIKLTQSTKRSLDNNAMHTYPAEELRNKRLDSTTRALSKLGKSDGGTKAISLGYAYLSHRSENETDDAAYRRSPISPRARAAGPILRPSEIDAPGQSKKLDPDSIRSFVKNSEWFNDNAASAISSMEDSATQYSFCMDRVIWKGDLENQAFIANEQAAHPKLVEAIRDIFVIPPKMKIATRLVPLLPLIEEDRLAFIRSILAYLMKELIFGDVLFSDSAALAATAERLFNREVAAVFVKDHYLTLSEDPAFQERLAAKIESHAVQFDDIMTPLAGTEETTRIMHREMVRDALQLNLKFAAYGHLRWTAIWANYDDVLIDKMHIWDLQDMGYPIPRGSLAGKRILMPRFAGVKIQRPDGSWMIIVPAEVVLQEQDTPVPERNGLVNDAKFQRVLGRTVEEARLEKASAR